MKLVLQTLGLLLPVVFPSWQFFREIAPSPRIEFALLASKETSANWQDFNLRPKQRSFIQILTSFFYNPKWNEALYIFNCAEALILEKSEYRVQEIFKRIIIELKRRQIDFNQNTHLQFRLVFISRQNGILQQDILYTSDIQKVSQC